MARQDFPSGKCRFFPQWSHCGLEGGGGGCGGGVGALLLRLSAALIHPWLGLGVGVGDQECQEHTPKTWGGGQAVTPHPLHT